MSTAPTTTDTAETSAQQKPTEASLGSDQSLVLIVEPLADKGHVRFKVTYHFHDPEKKPASEVEFHRGQFRACEAINTKLLGATPSDVHPLNLQRTAGDKLPKYEPPPEEETTATVPRAAHPEVEEPPAAETPTETTPAAEPAPTS